MMINKYGLKMTGLKNAVCQTFNGYGKTQICYNMLNGEIYTYYHIGNRYKQYDDNNIISICDTDRKMTMQEIADEIHTIVNGR